MTEQNILKKIMLAVSRLGATVFRNNTGQAWVGNIIHKDENTITLANYRPFRAGLTVGSSDLIGWHPVVITPDMVGQTLGVFLAIEVKTESGKPTAEQLNFIHAVRQAGGIAGICRNEKDPKFLIECWKKS